MKMIEIDDHLKNFLRTLSVVYKKIAESSIVRGSLPEVTCTVIFCVSMSCRFLLEGLSPTTQNPLNSRASKENIIFIVHEHQTISRATGHGGCLTCT